MRDMREPRTRYYDDMMGWQGDFMTADIQESEAENTTKFRTDLRLRQRYVEMQGSVEQVARWKIVSGSIFRVFVMENAPSLFLTVGFFNLQYDRLTVLAKA